MNNKDFTGDDEIRWLKSNLRLILNSDDTTLETVKLMAVKITAVRAFLDIIKHQNNLPITDTDDLFTTQLSDLDNIEPSVIAAEIRKRLQV